MKFPKITFLTPVIILSLFLPEVVHSQVLHSTDKEPNGNMQSDVYRVKDGTLLRIKELAESVPVHGTVLNSLRLKSGVAFVVIRGKELFAGVCEYSKLTEIKIGSFEPGSVAVKDLKSNNGVLYFMVEYYLNSSDINGVVKERDLFRCDLNSSSVQKISNVRYFNLLGNNVAFVKNEKLYVNGMEIKSPVEEISSIELMNENMILIKNSRSEFQIYNFQVHENVFFYRPVEKVQSSDLSRVGDNNIILLLSDSGKSESQYDFGHFAYYAVTVNGRYSERTETGPFSQTRRLKLKVEDGKNLQLKIERWVLDSEKKKYIRLNNIYQPKIIDLFLPKNCLLFLRMEFNGTDYDLKSEIYGKKTQN